MAKTKADKIKDILSSQLAKMGMDAEVSLTNDLGKVKWFSSGILALDYLIGKGFPRGRIVEIYGPESGGKTSVSLIAAGNVQRAGGVVAYIDAECALDMDWSAKLGVNNNELIYKQPSCGEEAFDIISMLIDTGGVDLIIVDSVAALTPRNAIEREMDKQGMAEQARLISQGLGKINAKAARTKTCIMFINQLRSTMAMYGPAETTPGGKALKFYASTRLSVKKDNKSIVYNKDKDPIAHSMAIRTVKNKVGPMLRDCTFTLFYEGGPDNRDAIIEIAIKKGIIEKKSAVSYYLKDNTGKEYNFRGRATILKNIANEPTAIEYIIKEAGIPEEYKNAFNIEREIVEVPDVEPLINTDTEE